MATIDKIVFSQNTPDKKNTLWARPSEKGTELLIFNKGKWGTVGADDFQRFHYEVYSSLEDITEPKPNALYLIGPKGEGEDKYDEYVYTEEGFTKIGDTSIDMSDVIKYSKNSDDSYTLKAEGTEIKKLKTTDDSTIILGDNNSIEFGASGTINMQSGKISGVKDIFGKNGVHISMSGSYTGDGIDFGYAPLKNINGIAISTGGIIKYANLKGSNGLNISGYGNITMASSGTLNMQGGFINSVDTIRVMQIKGWNDKEIIGMSGDGIFNMHSGILETSGVTLKSGGILTFGDGTTMSTAPGTTDYNDLINKPTKVSQFENDANYLTQHQDISGKQDALVAGRGIHINGNVISVGATEEHVSIAVTTEVSGVSVEGLSINVFYNDSETVGDVLVTDENGRAEISIPHDYKYKIVFPYIEGCSVPSPVVRLSSLTERAIDVEYEAESVLQERVRVLVNKREVGAITPVANTSVNVSIDGEPEVLTTDSTGHVEFYVPYGSEYTVSLPAMTGYYPSSPQTQVARRHDHVITMTYRYTEATGLLVIDVDGNEYAPEDFLALVEAGTKQKSDAKLVAFVTDTLLDNGGAFCLDIDMFAEDTFPENQRWASSNVQFNSIPLNGNSAAQPYYYDGLTASKRIQAEGDERGIETPFVDACLALSRTLNDGVVHQGFGGSTGQWNIAWNNRAAFDDILANVRDVVKVTLTAFTASKWTSTQCNASNAWTWATSAYSYIYNYKNYRYYVVPFFAF